MQHMSSDSYLRIVRGLKAQQIPESVGTGVKISPHSNSLPAHIHFKSMRLVADPAGAPQSRLVWRRSRKKFGKEEGGSGGENRLRVTFIMCSLINFFSFVLAG